MKLLKIKNVIISISKTWYRRCENMAWMQKYGEAVKRKKDKVKKDTMDSTSAREMEDFLGSMKQKLPEDIARIKVQEPK